MKTFIVGLSIPLALLMIAHVTSFNPGHQTAFLERIADKIEHVKAVPPETERAIRSAIQSIRRDRGAVGDQLDLRQQGAITRIESKLSHAEAVAARQETHPLAKELTVNIVPQTKTASPGSTW